jgi:hypothetical protein
VNEYVVVPVLLRGIVTVEDLLDRNLVVFHYAELQPVEGLVSYGLVLKQFVEGVREVAGCIYSFTRELLQLIDEPLLGADPPAPPLGQS